MERADGIGGLFFRSRAPEMLALWYRQHLGIDLAPGDYQQAVWQQSAGPTVLAPLPADTAYFGAPSQAWMVNFRVRNLDAMLAQLRAAGIGFEADPQAIPNGRFARLHDPEGNPIELWEPTGRDALVARASGSFEVKLAPLQPYNAAAEARIARQAIDKQFRGDLEASSKGEMISAGTNVPGSAGYVAIEQVIGSLHGRAGSFVLQHNATMLRGAPQLNIVVVPDSAGGALTGLAGSMAIVIDGGRHSYEFTYRLAGTP